MAVVGGIGCMTSFTLIGLSPAILGKALFAATSTFAGASLYAYMAPQRKLLALEAPLMGALVGLIVLNFGAIGAAYMGNPALAAGMMKLDMYLGLGVFSAFVAYDTHVAI